MPYATEKFPMSGTCRGDNTSCIRANQLASRFALNVRVAMFSTAKFLIVLEFIKADLNRIKL